MQEVVAMRRLDGAHRVGSEALLDVVLKLGIWNGRRIDLLPFA